MAPDLHQTIARVRRAMPRNADVMAICDALEHHLTKNEKPPFDKKAFMRDYMRRYRAKKAARN